MRFAGDASGAYLRGEVVRLVEREDHAAPSGSERDALPTRGEAGQKEPEFSSKKASKSRNGAGASTEQFGIVRTEGLFRSILY